MTSSSVLLRPETGIVRAKTGRAEVHVVDTALGAITLRITSDVPSLKALWLDLQRAAPSTAFQSYDCANAWTSQVLNREGRQAVIAVGYGPDGNVCCLLPFEKARVFGLPVLKWLAQDHANYNIGLFSQRAATELTADDLARLLREVARAAGVVAAAFESQPVMWDGVENPLSRLPRHGSANRGYAVKLREFETLYRHQFSKRSRHTLSRKERKLRDMGEVEYGWAETREEKMRVLNTFFEQKSEQFASLGIRNLFDSNARNFYRELALLDLESPSRLRLGYIKLDEAILATFSGFENHDRHYVALSSMANGETHRQSPGALLLRHQIREACDGGRVYFDLGVGKARHKDDWCDTVYELFDSFIAFGALGAVLTRVLAGRARIKRAIKSSPRLWPLAQKIRKRVRGRPPETA